MKHINKCGVRVLEKTMGFTPQLETVGFT